MHYLSRRVALIAIATTLGVTLSRDDKAAALPVPQMAPELGAVTRSVDQAVTPVGQRHRRHRRKRHRRLKLWVAPLLAAPFIAEGYNHGPHGRYRRHCYWNCRDFEGPRFCRRHWRDYC